MPSGIPAHERKLLQTESALQNSGALVLGLFEQAPISVQVVGIHNVLDDLHYVKTGFADFLRPALSGEVCDTREIVYDPADFGDEGEKMILSCIAFPLKDDNLILSIVILQNDVTKQRRTGADPSRLTLEITESLFINNIQDVIDKMNELVAAGIHFSIDDFETGYSSLSYLKRLPIQELKIDKSFVQDAPTDSNDAALVETILAVAPHMHLGVVAEGVETGAQASFLNARADVVHQGYLFGRRESADFWMQKWRNRV